MKFTGLSTRVIFAIVLLAGLSACQTAETPPSAGTATPAGPAGSSAPRTVGDANRAMEEILSAATVDEARTHYAGYTLASRDPWYGMRVEYFDPSGECYLWLPTKTQVETCTWTVTRRAMTSPRGGSSEATQPSICMTATSSGATAQDMGLHEGCRSAFVVGFQAGQEPQLGIMSPGNMMGLPEKLEGDPFGLKNGGAVPFVLEEKKQTSVEELKARAGTT